MTPLSLTLLIVGVFAASAGLTGWSFRRAPNLLSLDVPNARSSHSVAVPRGGGVAIVVSTVAALIVLGWTGLLDTRSVWSICGAGLLVAVIGFVDDRGHVPPRWRLAGHFAAAAGAMVALGAVPSVTLQGIGAVPAWLGVVLALLYLVWMLNLTNFMDGIDGIAGVEAFTVAVGGGVIAVVAAPGGHLCVAPFVLAAATLGFLVWNWPPAKIFMGDSGSGFLGLTLATLSLQAGLILERLLWSWLILLGAFVVDATVTLIRRLARCERVYEAHCSHAYQHAAARRGSHRLVTVTVGIINVCWLFPIALAVALGRMDGFISLWIAYLPLLWIVLRLEAGIADSAVP